MRFDLYGVLDRSIARKITAALFAIFFTTYAATALVVYRSVQDAIQDTERATLARLASLEIDRLSATVEQVSTNAAAWAKLDVMNDVVSGDVDKRVATALDDLAQLYALPGDIDVFDSADRLLASSSRVRSSGTLPDLWRCQGVSGGFIDKHADPFGGGDIVAVSVPVLASFQPGRRIGTLVATYRWPALTQQIFGAQTATILLRDAPDPRVLAADPPGAASVAQDLPLLARSVAGRASATIGGTSRWSIVTLGDADQLGRTLRWVATELLLLGAALAVPILGLGRWLAQRLTRPIIALTRLAGEITDLGAPVPRAPVQSQDELGTLARAFNTMTAGLERAAAERDRFVAALEALNESLEAKVSERTSALESAIAAKQRLIGDISHEVKSPLARLSMALGLARRADTAQTARQFDRMEREIDAIATLATELLTLARLDDPAARVSFDPVDLNDLLERIVADALYEQPARRDYVTVSTPDDPVMVYGNEDLLRRAIENVVRNALFYMAKDDGIAISLFCEESGVARLSVADDGPGVPLTALPHLFEPFYRVDGARARETGGSGIGLSICQRVIVSHGGAVAARPNTPNGLVVEITLPLMSGA